MMKVPIAQARRDTSQLVPFKCSPDQNVAFETSDTVGKIYPNTIFQKEATAGEQE